MGGTGRAKSLKRGIAAFFLVLIAFYLGPVGMDRPIPEPPAPPPPDVLPRPRFNTERIEQLISLQPEPEKDPPRA